MIDLVRSTGVCSTCRHRKSLIEFYANPKSASGRMYSCKACTKAYVAARHSVVTGMDRSSQMPVFDLGKPISYKSAHQRIHRWRGRASIHQCACGARAQGWAYRHDSQHERTEFVTRRGGNAEVAYSPDPMDYDPMCASCHTKFDRSRA